MVLHPRRHSQSKQSRVEQNRTKRIRLILEVSRSHTTTHHSRHVFSGQVMSSSQRPLPDNTQQNRQTSMPTVGFKPTISADELPQTYALYRTSTGTGNDNDNNNKYNNNLPNKHHIIYYWLNFDQHWPWHSANRITCGLCAVRNVGYSHVPTLPSPNGLNGLTKFIKKEFKYERPQINTNKINFKLCRYS